jgi:hypothetical protein
MMMMIVIYVRGGLAKLAARDLPKGMDVLSWGIIYKEDLRKHLVQ